MRVHRLTYGRFLIYGLFDPRDGQLRYVGKSSDGLKRPRCHACPGVLKRDHSHCGNWIRNLQSQGLTYEIEVFETHRCHADLLEAEKFWIAYYRSIGCRLTNHTRGGEGCWGRKNSQATRLRMSHARGGLSVEAREQACALYRLGQSLRMIAQQLKTGSKVIFRVLQMNNVPLRSKSEAHLLALAVGRR